MPQLLRFALALGLAVGSTEVAVRASPVRGFDRADVAGWLGLSVGLALLVCVGGASGLALARSRWAKRPALQRPEACVAAAVAGLFASINYRYEWVLNEFVADPKVWLGMPAAFLIGAALGAPAGVLLARRSWALLVVAALSAGAAVVRSRPVQTAGTESKPSVLIISMDTTRADAVSGLPTWGKLAGSGVVFSQAIAAAPITEPSHLAMLSGVEPWRSGIVSNGTILGERPALIVHDFRAAGYTTGAFVAGFPLHSRYGWAQGFDVYDDDFGRWPGAEALSLVKLWNQFALKEHALRERPAGQVVDRATRWLSRQNTPFFAFVHLYDAHGPYLSARNPELGPPPTEGEPLALPAYWPAPQRSITDTAWLSRAYALEVADVDAAVGALLASLGDRLDNTIVVLTADHGESLTEHGYLFDHGDDLYDPSLLVPLLVHWPKGGLQAGRSVDCQVGGLDVAPTVLELAGLAVGPGRDGHSLFAALRGESCDDHELVASTTAGRFVAAPPVDHAMRGHGRKLILKESGPAELYDVLADPGETRNLAPSPASEALTAMLRSRLSGAAEAASPEMDPATREALILLGYIDPEKR